MRPNCNLHHTGEAIFLASLLYNGDFPGIRTFNFCHIFPAAAPGHGPPKREITPRLHAFLKKRLARSVTEHSIPQKSQKVIGQTFRHAGIEGCARTATCTTQGKRYFGRHFCTMAIFQDPGLLIFAAFSRLPRPAMDR